MATTRRVKTREERRARRHRRVRAKVAGNAERPRLVVHRSINHVEGQVIDDVAGRTLVGLSTLAPELRENRGEVTKTEASRAAGGSHSMPTTRSPCSTLQPASWAIERNKASISARSTQYIAGAPETSATESRR